MSANELLYSVEDQIATITINRPERMNALTHGLEEELHRTFDKADADHSKRLSLREAAMLGCVLSLDSLAIGFGSGLGQHNYLFLGLFSLLLHPLAILLAYRLGKSAAGKLPAGCLDC